MMAWMLWRPSEALGRRATRCSSASAPARSRASAIASCACATTAVELNPQVIAACRLWFRLPADDARLAVRAGRCRRTGCATPRAARPACSVLYVDLYDHEAAGAGARRRSVLRRLPRAAGRRRRDERQPVRPPRQLRAQRGAHRGRVRRRPGLEPAPDARRQHHRGRRTAASWCRIATCWLARRAITSSRRFGPAGAQVAAHGAAAGAASRPNRMSPTATKPRSAARPPPYAGGSTGARCWAGCARTA